LFVSAVSCQCRHSVQRAHHGTHAWRWGRWGSRASREPQGRQHICRSCHQIKGALPHDVSACLGFWAGLHEARCWSSVSRRCPSPLRSAARCTAWLHLTTQRVSGGLRAQLGSGAPPRTTDPICASFADPAEVLEVRGEREDATYYVHYLDCECCRLHGMLQREGGGTRSQTLP
jgi:hypothetical protein